MDSQITVLEAGVGGWGGVTLYEIILMKIIWLKTGARG